MQNKQLIKISISSFIGLVLTYYLVFINKSFLWADHRVNDIFNNYRPDFLNTVFDAIYLIASPTGLIVGSIALILFFLFENEYRKTIFIFICVAGGEILETLIKTLTARPRPENALITINEYSFPSGHATLAMIFFLLVYYLLKNRFKKKSDRKLFLIINIGLIIVIGVGRSIINVHWTSDVVAGYLLGLFWFTLVLLLLNILLKNKQKSQTLK